MIVITHAHIDHIGGAAKAARPIRERRSTCTRPTNRLQQNRLDVQAVCWLGVETPEDPGIDKPAHEGDVFRAGSIEAHVLHTPGHTPGSISLYIPLESKVIAGDTLFEGSIGRTDLPGGNTAQIKQSIKSKLYTLPEETVVIPGMAVPDVHSAGKEAQPVRACVVMESR